MKEKDNKNIFQLFTAINFYDYTKDFSRTSTEKNYYILYSRSENTTELEVKKLIESQATTKFATITTGRDPSRLDIQLSRECDSMIALLESPEPKDVETLRSELNKWLTRWDNEYRLDARDYYPEYIEFFKLINYGQV